MRFMVPPIEFALNRSLSGFSGLNPMARRKSHDYFQ